jgi:DNA-binding CsgD family transcriptional regulator
MDSQHDERASPTSGETDPVALIGAPVLEALERIDLLAYVFDRTGTLRWANEPSARLIGDRVGQSFVNIVSPETRQWARTQFARKVVGGEATAYSLTVVDSSGRRTQLSVRSAPLRRANREIIGVLGFAMREEDRQAKRHERIVVENVQLTPRQTEVLRLLGEGLSTEAIARRLGIAVETARNHIRGVLRGLGVHSRLEAVIEGRERGLLDA